MKTGRLIILAVVCTGLGPAHAEGVSGLVQAIDTPSAFAMDVDDLTIAFDYREDYRALAFGFQATERLGIALSFPTYENNGSSSSGNELSFSYLVLRESAIVPNLEVGIVGFGRDDRGAGEYVAIGKSLGDFRVSAGLGWGRYASLYDGPRGDTTTDDIVTTDHLFSAESAPFANVVWATPVSGLTATAEFSGIETIDDDPYYAFGLGYEFVPGVSIAGFANNQGDSGLRFTFLANPDRPYIQENIGRGPHPFVERTPAMAARPQPQAEQVLAVLRERLEDDGIRITRFAMTADTIDVTAASGTDVNFARTTGRVTRVLSAVAPARITTFRVTQNTGAFDTNVIVLDRAGLEQAVSKPDATALAWDATVLEASPLTRPAALGETPFVPRFSYSFNPVFKADFVTSEDLQLTGTLNANAQYVFSPQTVVAGSLGYRFLNQWTQTAPPAEPEVRSDITAYTPDEIYLQALTVRHRFRISPEVYSRVSAGLFERAYGGVSGEVFWRSPEQNFALGLEASYVQKRAYEDWFGFEDADATTVIGSVYANIGQNGGFAVLDAGQHLAGDFAVGLTLGRNYSNGWRIAASTGWSEESDAPLKFGAELAIPLSWTTPDGGTDSVNLSAGGPSGNFGSRVAGTGLLYNELRSSDRKRIEDAWGQFWN